MKKRKQIKRSELSNIMMVAGNEKRFTTVADDGIIRDWVGFGWIEVDRYKDINNVSIDIPIVIDG
tara:strand:+ start:1832 stop:2026 length:195 start_codon:yes stop_codon:yes gene_type:complete